MKSSSSPFFLAVDDNLLVSTRGFISRLHFLDHAASTFLIDALTFPGNSGGRLFQL
jgi:hypothetical protein